MIDRDLQREILFKMKKSYPDAYQGELFNFTEAGSRKNFEFNLAYLEEHHLITNAYVGVKLRLLTKDFKEPPEHETPVHGKITAAGIDFLENDGGLTAILGIVTVKLHIETLSALEGKILASEELPTEEKTRLLDRLRSLPEEGAKTLIQEMVKAGLSKGPEVWETALRFLSS